MAIKEINDAVVFHVADEEFTRSFGHRVVLQTGPTSPRIQKLIDSDGVNVVFGWLDFGKP